MKNCCCIHLKTDPPCDVCNAIPECKEYLIDKRYLKNIANPNPKVDSKKWVEETKAWFDYLESEGMDVLDYLSGII